MKTFNKLVRDNVIDFIKRDGHTPSYKKLPQKEFKTQLLVKLKEEAAEVALATDKAELIVELADVLEVIEAIKTAFKIEGRDLTLAKNRKKKERGAYTKKLFLETIDEQ